ncbi:glycosyltransferase family 4 protein [bacterium]|nr:glycosyltransferase family 4 protein [bacterium]
MRICMISYSQYEFDNRVHRYGESLIKRGDDVDVICLGTPEQDFQGSLNGVRLFRIQSRDYNEKSPITYLARMLKFFWKAGCLCTRLHFKSKYQIMHFHNIPDFGIFAMTIPKLFGAKIVFDNHDLVPEFYQRKFNLEYNHIIIRMLRLVEKMACKFSHHVITVTTIWEKTLISRSVTPAKCSVVLNTPDPDIFFRDGSELPVKKKGPYILSYHGNLTEIFGIDLAISALPRVLQAFPNTQLHIYGQGKTRLQLHELACSLKVEKFVILHDPVPRKEVALILKKADLGIDPKRDGVLAGEGLSSKCMEYHAMGLPSVVSAIKAATTYYDDKMVTFFRPGDIEDLADKIIFLLKNPAKREEQVHETLRFVENHHWSKYEIPFHKMLDKLAGI